MRSRARAPVCAPVAEDFTSLAVTAVSPHSASQCRRCDTLARVPERNRCSS
jgi:hypothetical protein